MTDAALNEGAPTGVFNVSTGEGHTIKEVFDVVVDHLGVALDAPVPIIPPRCRRRARSRPRPLSYRSRTGLEGCDRFCGERSPNALLVRRARGRRSVLSSRAPERRCCRVEDRRVPPVPESDFEGKSILVVGGAGFVGSNLCHMLLEHDPRSLSIVDNLFRPTSATCHSSPNVRFRLGSIADDKILEALPRDLDYVFHLACFHGNQSSIADPMLTTTTTRSPA